MNAPKKNNRLDNIIKDLSSGDEKKITIALKQIRKHGNKEVIAPLIKLLSSSTNAEVNEEVISILFDLKDQSVADELIHLIENEIFPDRTDLLISIFWQSSLDGSQYISTFINEAIKGDYIIGVEVLSVIDTFETTFDETEIEELKYDLDEAIAVEESEKATLLSTIKSAIELLNVEY